MAQILHKRELVVAHPMQWAARNGQTRAIKTLIDHDVSINQNVSGGVTALMEAVFYNQVEAVKFLLANGADVNARAENGSTALHIAHVRVNVEIGRILLEHDADPAIETDDGGKIPQSFIDQLRR